MSLNSSLHEQLDGALAENLGRHLGRQEQKFDHLVSILSTPSGLVQALAVVVCVYLGVLVARQVYRRVFRDHPERYERLGPYLLFRLVLPLTSSLLCLGASLAATRFFGLSRGDIAVLGVANIAMIWLGVIRVVAGGVRSVLPEGKVEQGTEHFLAMTLWIGFITYVLGFDAMVIDWLESVSFAVGKSRLNLLMILNAVLWVSVILFLALWIGRLLDRRMMALTNVDMSLRIVVSKLIRTAMVILAVLIALPVVGIDLTVLSVFGGALGVGLGFGLQKIASNYVSGFIILLDRAVRIGDRVTIDNRTGIIREITARYVVLRLSDGTDALIPNEALVSSTVVNSSYSDRAVWQSLDVGVAYGADLELAMRLMTEAAAEVPRVQKDPAPAAFLAAFADSSVNLTLGYWVGDPENGLLGPRSAINLGIWRKFGEHGIDIPFPQRELRIVHEGGAPQRAPETAGQENRA